MKPAKIQLRHDNTRGVAYGYKPLIDFILGQGGVVGGWAPPEDYPFYTNKSGTFCTLYSDVSYEDIMSAFEFDEGVTVTQAANGKFVLSDDKLWLQIIFENHAAHARHKESETERSAEQSKVSAVFDIKSKALEAANPKEKLPKGRVRISVKPRRSAREAYYPVIEYAIAQGCVINPIDGDEDQYFSKDSGGSYVCMLTGNLPARRLFNEFEFRDDVITPDIGDTSGYVIYDKDHGILISISNA